MFKKVSVVIIVFIIFSVGFEVMNIGPQLFSLEDDQVVATVNKEKIYKSELETAVKSATPKLSKDESEEMKESTIKKQIEQKALEKLIHKELVLQEAKKEKFSLSKEEKMKAFTQIEAQFQNKSELKAVLEKYNLTEQELKEKVEEELIVESYLENKVAGQAGNNRQEVIKLYLEQLKKRNKIDIHM